MKTRKPIGSVAGLALFAILSAAAGAHADPDGMPSRSFAPLARLLPRQILAGPQAGFTGSRLKASSDYNALIRPTPAAQDEWTAPSYGATISARWSCGLSLTLSPRYETYGVSTREQTVSFPDNPFPHTLKSSTELNYSVWPLLLGMGWFTSRQHFQAQLGTYAEYFQDARFQWTVDGQPYANEPQPQFRDTQSGWILGAEYGMRMGPGELSLGVESQNGFHSLFGGLRGSVKAQSARMNLAYAFTLMRR